MTGCIQHDHGRHPDEGRLAELMTSSGNNYYNQESDEKHGIIMQTIFISRCREAKNTLCIA